MARAEIVSPFGGFQQSQQSLAQIAQVEQGAKRLQLEERRLEGAEQSAVQSLETARSQLDMKKIELLLGAGEPQAAADIYNSSSLLNPQGAKLTFEGMFQGKTTYNNDLGGFVQVGQDGSIEVKEDVPGLAESRERKKTAKEESIRTEAEIKKEVAGPSRSQLFNELALEIVDDPNDLNKEQVKAINQRITTIKKERSAVAGTGLQKPTVVKLEDDIKAGQTNLEQFKRVGELFDPRFLTLGGKVKLGVERMKDFLAIEGVVPDKEYLEQRRKWFQASKNSFLRYRKWVTGVAGGEKEFAEIAKAFVDPDDTTPIEFAASLEEADDWQRIVLRWTENVLANGFESTAPASANGITISQARQQLEDEGAFQSSETTPGQNLTPQQELEGFLSGNTAGGQIQEADVQRLMQAEGLTEEEARGALTPAR